MEDQGNKDDGRSVDSDEHKDEPAENVAWDFHDSRDYGHRGMSGLQAIRDLCTK